LNRVSISLFFVWWLEEAELADVNEAGSDVRTRRALEGVPRDRRLADAGWSTDQQDRLGLGQLCCTSCS